MFDNFLKITISKREYKELLEAKNRLEIAQDFVSKSTLFCSEDIRHLLRAEKPNE